MVSIIIPVYNAERYLQRCLSSAIEQTYQDLEIICIDNKSTDHSVDILWDYAKKDPRIQIIENKVNRGQAYSMNLGFETAAGEYFCELDSDDFLDRTFVEKLVHEMEEKDLDFIRCSHFGFAEEPFRTERCQILPEELCGFVYHPKELQGSDLGVVFGRMIALFSGMWKTDLFRKNDIRFREGVNFEDTSVEFKARLYADRCSYFSEPLYYYRRDNAGSGSATIKDSSGMFRQYDEILRVVRETGEESRLRDFLHVRMAYDFMWALNRVHEPLERRQFLQTAREYRKKVGTAPDEWFNSNFDAANCRALFG